MKTIQLNNKSIEILTELSEINISQFEKVMDIYKKKYDTEYERDIDIITILSELSVDEIESLDLDIFDSINKTINIQNFEILNTNSKIINEINVNGITYKSRAIDNKFIFSVKEFLSIKNKLKESIDTVVLDVALIVFKPINSDINIDTVREDFKSGITMDIMSPYLMILSDYLDSKK